jgi:hypothetical protein
MRWMFLVLVSMLACTTLRAQSQEIKVTDEDRFTIANTQGIRAEVVPIPAGVMVGGAGQGGQAGAGSEVAGVVRALPEDGEGFAMTLVFSAKGELGTMERLEQAVAEDSAPYVGMSVEKKAQFKTLKYAGRAGVYAVFTDARLVEEKTPRPNDYRYAVVGIVRLSEASVLRFNLLVNDLGSQDYFGPLHYALSFIKAPDEASMRPATRP